MDHRITLLREAIRDVPDFPKPGIIFKDITPVLGDSRLFATSIELFAESLKDKKVDLIAAIEARGFIFAATLAYKLGLGFLPIRKPGKLPYKTFRESYQLEYGTDSLEIHQDAVQSGQNVALIDDLLATGGTALAAARLIEQCGGKVTAIRFLIELDFLKGRENLKNYDVHSFIHF